MILLPVIERELRAESRHPLTYWLRVVGAASLLLAAVAYWVDQGFRERQGGALFALLHQTLFWGIWILVPLLTADCVSRERREGTLGLLFLTPLRAGDIAVAKGLAHGLRGMTAFLSALPVIVIPFLMGGVDWRIATASTLLNLASFLWALSAGVLASSRNRTLTGSLCWAALWAFLLFWMMIWLCGFLFLNFVFSARSFTSPFTPPPVLGHLAAGLAVVLSFDSMWQLARVPPPGQAVWIEAYIWVLALSLLALIALWWFAARNIRQAWQDRPPSVRRQKIERRLFTPAFGLRFFRVWMRRTLERNPVGWLERRTWQARLVSWSWLAVMISIYSWALSDTTGGFNLRAVNSIVSLLLVGSIALSAAGSFRRERELGVMELLLVSPLRVDQIIAGRVRGLWAQFLPAVLLFVTVWQVMAAAGGSGRGWRAGSYGEWMSAWQFGIAFTTLPVVGLYFSLRCRHYLVAALMTLLTGLVLPYEFSLLFQMALDHRRGGVMPELWPLLAWLVAGFAAWRAGTRSQQKGFAWPIAAWTTLPPLLSVICNGAGYFAGVSTGQVLKDVSATYGVALMAASVQVLLAIGFGALLHRNLVRRTFALAG